MTPAELPVDLPSIVFPIERGKVREFASAILDDPDRCDRDGEVVPATFALTMACWPPEPAALPPLPFSGLLLHADQEFEYLAPVTIGMTLTARSTLTRSWDGADASGRPLRFYAIETVYGDDGGAAVLVGRATIVQPLVDQP